MARLMGVLLLAGCAFAVAADGPSKEPTAPRGSWKVTLALQEQTLWIVSFDEKGGKWSGAIVAAEKDVGKSVLERVSVGKESLQFTIRVAGSKFQIETAATPDKDGKLLGSAVVGGKIFPVALEPTKATSFDDVETAKETLEREKGGPGVLRAALFLIQSAESAKVEEVRAWAARGVKAAQPYGVRYQRDFTLKIAEALSRNKAYAPVALQYAQTAERQLDDGDPAALRKRTLEVLAAALTAAGKTAEAGEVEARAAKVDTSIKVTPFPARKGGAGRTVLVELFTGAECPPCVAADLAFDALSRAYQPSEVVLLQYHLHIPGPDPLTNADSETRADFYLGQEQGTPSVFFSGAPGAEGGGDALSGGEKYEEFTALVGPLLEKPAGLKLSAAVARAGDKIDIDATVGDVTAVGKNLKLRVVLVEEEVAYKGGNRLAEHHYVVRAFPGGVDGKVVAKGKPTNQKASVDLAALRKAFNAYLDDSEKMFKKTRGEDFAFKSRPMLLKKLKVVVFVQNDDTREVLEAVQIDVPAGS